MTEKDITNISLVKKAKKSASSWGNNEIKDKFDELDSIRSGIYTRTYAEQWAINANVHYNSWANFSENDFRPVAEAFQDLCGVFVCVFNKIIGDSGFELEFASFLENCDDIISYIKNYFAVHFKIDYKNANGDISNYYPDFIVKKSLTEIYIVETKGLEDLDVPEKMHRLKQWIEDINKAQSNARFDFIFVDEEGFGKYKPKTFADLITNFRKYMGDTSVDGNAKNGTHLEESNEILGS